MSNVLIPKNEVKGVTTRGREMTSEASHSKKINETGFNKNEPLRFKQDVQEKPHDDGVENKSSSIRERTTQPSKHKEAEDLAADHSSRLENPHMKVLNKREIFDKFSDEHLMELKSKSNNDEPWYANFVNYIVGKVVPLNWTFKKRKRFFSQVKTYFWEEPYAFKLCADNIMRRCVVGSKTLEILAHCHSGPIGGHLSANVTAKKVYESGFYWPSVFKDANEYVYEFFDVWGLDFMGPFPQSRGNKYILVAVDYVSKWVEAQALPTNDARVVVKFLRSLFARESRLMQLNELATLRDGAYENTRIYKERTKKWHDSRLRGDKDFKVGDKVLLYNSCLKMYPGKLKSKWSSSNIVKTVYQDGAIEITDETGLVSRSNENKMKKYYRGNIGKEDDEVLEFKDGVK
ncbi:reverse transcriptase domain-containing protein [Tanacetum coccineum]